MKLVLPGVVAIIIMSMAVTGVSAELVGQTWEKTATLVANDIPVGDIALSPDGSSVAVALLKPGDVQIVDTTTGAVEEILPVPVDSSRKISDVVYSPDGSVLYGSGQYGDGVFAWDTESGKHLDTFAKGVDGSEMALNPSSTGSGMVMEGAVATSSSLPVLAVENKLGTVEVRDAADKNLSGSPVKVIDRVVSSNPISDMEFVPDGTALAVVSVDGPTSSRHGEYCEVRKDSFGRLVCWPPRGIALPSFPGDVDVAPDGKQSAVGVLDGQAVLIDRSTGKLTKLQAYDKGAVCVEYFPDGRLATGGANGEVKIWDPATQTCLSQFDTGEQGVRDIEISGDNTTIFTGGVDGTVQRWDAVAPTPMPNM